MSFFHRTFLLTFEVIDQILKKGLFLVFCVLDNLVDLFDGILLFNVLVSESLFNSFIHKRSILLLLAPDYNLVLSYLWFFGFFHCKDLFFRWIDIVQIQILKRLFSSLPDWRFRYVVMIFVSPGCSFVYLLSHFFKCVLFNDQIIRILVWASVIVFQKSLSKLFCRFKLSFFPKIFQFFVNLIQMIQRHELVPKCCWLFEVVFRQPLKF